MNIYTYLHLYINETLKKNNKRVEFIKFQYLKNDHSIFK